MPRTTKKAKATELFRRADKYYDQGRLKQAFRLMLAAAKLGDAGAQVNVANYFDHGQGVRRNRAKAFYWYRRAYRRGDRTAAHNIAIVYRRERQLQRALAWFFKAVRAGDPEAHLEIGKHYMENENNLQKAIHHFRRVLREDHWVSEAGTEEAAALLKKAERTLKGRRGPRRG